MTQAVKLNANLFKSFFVARLCLPNSGCLYLLYIFCVNFNGNVSPKLIYYLQTYSNCVYMYVLYMYINLNNENFNICIYALELRFSIRRIFQFVAIFLYLPCTHIFSIDTHTDILSTKFLTLRTNNIYYYCKVLLALFINLI